MWDSSVVRSQTVLLSSVMVPLCDSACSFICMLNYLRAAGSSTIHTAPKDIPSAWQWVIFSIYEQEIIGFFMFSFTFPPETTRKWKNVITGPIKLYLLYKEKLFSQYDGDDIIDCKDFNKT